jgi:hypothetical protein
MVVWGGAEEAVQGGYPCGLAGRGLGPEVLEQLADGLVGPRFCTDRVVLSGCRLEVGGSLKWQVVSVVCGLGLVEWLPLVARRCS